MSVYPLALISSATVGLQYRARCLGGEIERPTRKSPPTGSQPNEPNRDRPSEPIDNRPDRADRQDRVQPSRSYHRNRCEPIDSRPFTTTAAPMSYSLAAFAASPQRGRRSPRLVRPDGGWIAGERVPLRYVKLPSSGQRVVRLGHECTVDWARASHG